MARRQRRTTHRRTTLVVDVLSAFCSSHARGARAPTSERAVCCCAESRADTTLFETRVEASDGTTAPDDIDEDDDERERSGAGSHAHGDAAHTARFRTTGGRRRATSSPRRCSRTHTHSDAFQKSIYRCKYFVEENKDKAEKENQTPAAPAHTLPAYIDVSIHLVTVVLKFTAITPHTPHRRFSCHAGRKEPLKRATQHVCARMAENP